MTPDLTERRRTALLAALTGRSCESEIERHAPNSGKFAKAFARRSRHIITALSVRFYGAPEARLLAAG